MSRRLYWSEVALVLAALIPIVIAEGSWWLLGATIGGAALGWWRTVRLDGPLLGAAGSRIAAVLAFAFMVAECLTQLALPVLSLAHFMAIVCACKFLQRRSLRDHAHLFVLALLLLVVGAIVSATLIFPIALAVFLTVGLNALIRFHLMLEAARAAGGEEGLAREAVEPGRVTLLPGAVVGTFGVVVGVAVFLTFPRIGAGLLGQFQSPVSTGGPVMTGFAPALNFNTIGPIQESDQPVMRVQVAAGDGTPMQLPGGPYFRGSVLSQYHILRGLFRATWEWQRLPVQSGTPYHSVVREADPGGRVSLLAGPEGPELIQTYWLETNEANVLQQLFACYPAVEVQFEGQAPDEVKKWLEDGVLQVRRPQARLMRYTVRSALRQASAAEALRSEREAGGAPADPPLVGPADPLPREPEMRELISRLSQDIGPLDVPRNQLFLMQRLRDYLTSGEFAYTLQPPPVRRGDEPVGEFLFNSKRGHCEYFASAMAVLAQLAGVPARVVCGYCGGDYNPVGGFYVVRQKHAHSWVEAYIPGMDWVSFDPTPSSEMAGQNRSAGLGLSKYVDYFQFLWVNIVVSYDADRRRELFTAFTAWLLRPVQSEHTLIGGLAAFIRELFGWRLDLTWHERAVYWIFTLLVLAAGGLLAYVSWMVGKSNGRRICAWVARLRRGGLPPELRFYEQFQAKLAAMGLSRRPDQTPFEFATEAAQKLPACADAEFLVASYYGVRYGGRNLSPVAAERIEELLAGLAAK